MNKQLLMRIIYTEQKKKVSTFVITTISLFEPKAKTEVPMDAQFN